MPLLAQTTTVPKAGRDYAFDAMRLVAAIAVIVVHSPGLDGVPLWSLPLRFAVPFFTCAAVHFAFTHYGKQRPPEPLRAYFDDRFERVYRPFVAWSLVYAVSQLVAYWVGIADAEPKIGPELFLFGTAAHLWFIPFILFAGVAVYAVMPIIMQIPMRSGAAAAVVAFGLTLWQMLAPGRPEDLPLPVQLLARSTSIFAGTAIAAWVACCTLSAAARRSIALSGVVVAIAGSWLAVETGGSRVMWGTAIGVAVYCTCLGGLRWAVLRPLGALGPYSLGVYFAHYAFVEGYEDLGRKFLRMELTPGNNALLIVAALASAILVVWLLSRHPATRRLVR